MEETEQAYTIIVPGSLKSRCNMGSIMAESTLCYSDSMNIIVVTAPYAVS